MDRRPAIPRVYPDFPIVWRPAVAFHTGTTTLAAISAAARTAGRIGTFPGDKHAFSRNSKHPRRAQIEAPASWPGTSPFRNPRRAQPRRPGPTTYRGPSSPRRTTTALKDLPGFSCFRLSLKTFEPRFQRIVPEAPRELGVLLAFPGWSALVHRELTAFDGSQVEVLYSAIGGCGWLLWFRACNG